MLFNHLILCHSLLILPSIFPRIRAFLNESPLCIRWSEFWSFSFSISPLLNEYSGLISFKIDWIDLLAIQGDSQESSPAPQFESIDSECSVFFMVQLSHSYKTTGKIIASTPLQFSSVAQLCPTLCNPMNRSTSGLPVHHQLPEFTQTHVHRVGDAIQPSHPLSSPSPPALNLSQLRI